jgi:CubicO group peptidase (beta-lactamase class C family)
MNFQLRCCSQSALLFLMLLFTQLPAAGQPAAAPSAQDIRTRVDEYMRAAVEVERFMGSILIARDGQVIVSKGYGMANIEHGAPNTPGTVFRLASVSKQFTAAAILILQERGKLSVGDSVCKYLERCPAAWQPVTIRHLLTMTHGVPNVSAMELGPLRGFPVPWDQWMEAVAKKPLEYVPGERFQYLNGGYTLLGFVIERVSGKSYGEFVRENIFLPLGMNQTGHEDPRRIIEHRATGYTQLPGDPVANVQYREIVRMYAAGGIYSTTEDLLRWDNSLYSEKLLSRRSIEEMFTPFREMMPGKQYGYGWWKTRKHGRDEWAHGGNAVGFITNIARYPSERVVVIVLSNNEKGSSGKISNALSAITFGAPYDLPKERVAVSVPREALTAYVGEYRVEFPPTSFVITLEDGKLMSKRSGEGKSELFAESPTKFFLRNEDIQFTFSRDDAGAVTGVLVDQGDGTVYEYLKARKIK